MNVRIKHLPIPEFFSVMLTLKNGDIRYTGHYDLKSEAEAAANDLKQRLNTYEEFVDTMVIKLGGY